MNDTNISASESQLPSENQSASDTQQATGVIYKITCLINKKIYVGKTKQKLSKRMAQHRYGSKKGKSALELAIQKYGWENFTVEVIEVCLIELLDKREKFWIVELNSRSPNGYNLTDGGEGLVNPSAETRAKMSANHPDISGEKNPNYGKHHSAETIAKISAALKGKPSSNKGRKHTAEARAKMSANHADVSGEKNPNYGKPRSPETCAKISAANKGKPSPNKGKKHSDETKAKISAARKGQPSSRKGTKHTEESKAKMSASKKGKKGKKHTDESKAKMSAAHKGKPSPLKGTKRSAETIAKISAGQKAAWARRKKAIENGEKK